MMVTKISKTRPAIEVEILPLDVIQVVSNIGYKRCADDELVASVRERGVLQPVVAHRNDAGDCVLIAGHRRVDAAKKVGLLSVPVIVHNAGLSRAELLAMQATENLARCELTPLEEAETYEQLVLEFGDIDTAAGSIGRPVELVRQGVAIAGSQTAKNDVAAHQLTFEQGAKIAEIESSEWLDEQERQDFRERFNNGQHDYWIEYTTGLIERRRAAAQRRAELEAEGIVVLGEDDRILRGIDAEYVLLENLRDADGNKLNEETHRKCPGHVAKVYGSSGSDDVEYGCHWWRRHGHTHAFENDDESPSDESKESSDVERMRAEEERREQEAIADAQAARKVRQRFISEQLQGVAPKGWQLFVSECLAAGMTIFYRGSELLDEFGIDKDWVGESQVRAGIHIFAVLVDRIEENMRDTWTVHKSLFSYHHIIRYLRYLKSLGYELSPCEAKEVAAADGGDGDGKAQD